VLEYIEHKQFLQPPRKMLLIGYRLLFECVCSFLNVIVDPDVDYIENDEEREKLELALMNSVRNTNLTVFEMYDRTYYLGLRTDICKRELPDVMTAHEMSDKIAMLTIQFHRELKQVGLFKHMKSTSYLQEPSAIQYNW